MIHAPLTKVTAHHSGTLRGGELYVADDDPDTNTVTAFRQDQIIGWVEHTNDYAVDVFLTGGHTVRVTFLGDSIDERYSAMDLFRDALTDLPHKEQP